MVFRVAAAFPKLRPARGNPDTGSGDPPAGRQLSLLFPYINSFSLAIGAPR
jgi:hypothetical protein